MYLILGKTTHNFGIKKKLLLFFQKFWNRNWVLNINEKKIVAEIVFNWDQFKTEDKHESDNDKNPVVGLLTLNSGFLILSHRKVYMHVLEYNLVLAIFNPFPVACCAAIQYTEITCIFSNISKQNAGAKG